MPDTHINAFFADVDEKLAVVQQAQGELEAAKERLEAKKKEVGWKEPETETQSTTQHQTVAVPKEESANDNSKKKK